jgi:uncharacterized protein YndB with AHSA1/START domain
MAAAITEQTVNMLEIVKEEEIAAPMDVVFETILEEMGPRNMAETTAMPMKLEAWPGGRWFRDLGNGAGHWWGTVQAIRPPSLIEIYGPLFMSYPASSNIQYRLKEENGVTVLKFTHRAMAWISYDPQIKEQLNNVQRGWGSLIERIAKASVSK